MKAIASLFVFIFLFSTQTSLAGVQSTSKNTTSVWCGSWHKVKSATTGEVIGKYRDCRNYREYVTYK